MTSKVTPAQREEVPGKIEQILIKLPSSPGFEGIFFGPTPQPQHAT